MLIFNFVFLVLKWNLRSFGTILNKKRKKEKKIWSRKRIYKVIKINLQCRKITLPIIKAFKCYLQFVFSPFCCCLKLFFFFVKTISHYLIILWFEDLNWDKRYRYKCVKVTSIDHLYQEHNTFSITDNSKSLTQATNRSKGEKEE